MELHLPEPNFNQPLIEWTLTDWIHLFEPEFLLYEKSLAKRRIDEFQLFSNPARRRFYVNEILLFQNVEFENSLGEF